MGSIYYGLSKISYEIGEDRLASGGEGSIHRIIGNDRQVAKVFKPGKRDSRREEKLRLMVQYKLSESQMEQVTWPQDVIYNQDGFAGYIMPKIEHASSLTQIYASNTYDLRYRLLAAINLCAAIDTVHEMEQVCGDLNPQNICINLNKADQQNAFKVTLVDTDSYHFISGGETYRCEVGMGDFIAPELQKKMAEEGDLKSVSLPSYTRETDLFALAVHIFYLLMNGCHPFACAKDSNRTHSNMEQMTGETAPDSVVAPQPIENIKTGFFPFYEQRKEVAIPIYAPEFESLPEDIRALFIRTFVDGYQDPKKRVSAIEWQRALTPLLEIIVQCSIDQRHFYFGVGKECPLCRIEGNIKQVFGVIDGPLIDEELDDVEEEKVDEKKKQILWWVIGIAISLILTLNSLPLGIGFGIIYMVVFYVVRFVVDLRRAISSMNDNMSYDCIPTDIDELGDINVLISNFGWENGDGTKTVLNKLPSQDCLEYYKDQAYDDGDVLDFRTVKLGENYFVKIYVYDKDDHDYCVSYIGNQDGTEYDLFCAKDTKFTSSDCEVIEKIISSLQILELGSNQELENI